MGSIDLEGLSPISVVNYINNLGRKIHKPLPYEEILRDEKNEFCFQLSMEVRDGIMLKAKGKGNTRQGAKNNAAMQLLKLLNLSEGVMSKLKKKLSPNKNGKKSGSLKDNSSDNNGSDAVADLWILCAKKKYPGPAFNSGLDARFDMKHHKRVWLVSCSVQTDTDLVLEIGQNPSRNVAKNIAAEMVLESLKRLRNKDRAVKVNESNISGRQTAKASELISQKNFEDDANENAFETKDDKEELTSKKISFQKYVIKPKLREIYAFDSFDESSVKSEEVDEIIQELQKKHEFIRYIEYKLKASSVSNGQCFRCLIQVTDNPPSFFVGTASTELEARMKCSVEFISYLKKKPFTYNKFSMFMP